MFSTLITSYEGHYSLPIVYEVYFWLSSYNRVKVYTFKTQLRDHQNSKINYNKGEVLTPLLVFIVKLFAFDNIHKSYPTS